MLTAYDYAMAGLVDAAGHRRHSGGRQPVDGRAGTCQHAAGHAGRDDLSRRDGGPGGAACPGGRRHAVPQLPPGRVQGHRERRPHS